MSSIDEWHSTLKRDLLKYAIDQEWDIVEVGTRYVICDAFSRLDDNVYRIKLTVDVMLWSNT